MKHTIFENLKFGDKVRIQRSNFESGAEEFVYEKTEKYMEMASHIQEIQNLCLAGKFVEAAEMVPEKGS